MDTTTIGIIAGLFCAGVDVGLHLYLKKGPDMQCVILVFLAAFSIPSGLGLIMAGCHGKVESLPSNWREYVAVSGIVAIWLSGKYILNRVRACLQKSNKTTSID
jgi:hypothetical protein